MNQLFKFLVIILIGLFVYPAYGQTNCSKNKIIGEWIEVTNMCGVHTNIDSLQEIANISKDTMSVWSFKANDTYYYKNKYYTKGEPFTYEDSKCEIILGTKKRSKKHSNLEIIYIDNDLMIFKSDNNPKGYFTHILKKK